MTMSDTTQESPAFAGPLYMQVASMLRSKICAAEWTPRAPLPNEVALARDVGVSLGTMRKALELLESERLIERRQGRGTFVVEPSLDSERARYSNLMSGGKRVGAPSVTWHAHDGHATDAEARVLAVSRGADVYRFDSHWAADGGTTAVEQITVSAQRFPGLPHHISDGGQFLFPLYRRHYRLAIGKVSESLKCMAADEALAEALLVGQGQPLLQISRIAFAVSGQPVEWSRCTLNPGKAEYVVTMS